MENLKTSDLRIGNLVTDNWGSSIYEVDSINSKGINLFVEDDGNWSELAKKWVGAEYSFEDIKGIELTEEWLIKFGFVNNEHLIFDTYFKRDLGRGRRLVITDIGTPNFMVMLAHGGLSQVGRQDDVVTLHNWDYDKNMHVHQLQNLFCALTGEELVWNVQQ